MGTKSRVAVAALSMSAAAFITWQTREGYTDHAVIPTKGDVPTIGHGSTHYESGAPVKMGDHITRKRAGELARNLANQDGQAMAKALPGVKLTQGEYDVYLDFVGQYGIGNFRGSTMRRELLAGHYAAACHGLLKFKYSAGYDCSTPGNTRCMGVWTRQQARFQQCMGEQ